MKGIDGTHSNRENATPTLLRSTRYSKGAQERAYLEEDLTRIECIGLMSKPWSVKDEKMVRDLVTRALNQYEWTVRAHLESWSIEK